MTTKVDGPEQALTSAPVDTGGTPYDERQHDRGRLLVTAPDRPGIVAEVSRFLFANAATILELQQYSTNPFGGTFFLRVEFHRDHLAAAFPELRARFTRLSDAFSMSWTMARPVAPKTVAIFASTADHALQELLWRAQSGELRAHISMVVSNHRKLERVAAGFGIPFHHIPVTARTREAAETAQLDLIRGTVDLVVLARYMQILSPRFLASYTGSVINIHHSFLPAFVGADPYGQAARRGVKLVGATAHYVTPELDAGPIIEQDLVRVDHRHSVADLRRVGRDVERAVLARAVAWHLEDRVIVHQNKTVVFV